MLLSLAPAALRPLLYLQRQQSAERRRAPPATPGAFGGDTAASVREGATPGSATASRDSGKSRGVAGEAGRKSRERGKEEARRPLVPLSPCQRAGSLSPILRRGQRPSSGAGSCGGRLGGGSFPSLPAETPLRRGGRRARPRAGRPPSAAPLFFHPERCPGEARRGCRCREKQDGGGCHPASPVTSIFPGQPPACELRARELPQEEKQLPRAIKLYSDFSFFLVDKSVSNYIFTWRGWGDTAITGANRGGCQRTSCKSLPPEI